MRERSLARLIPLRPWISLSSFLLGAALTVPAFIMHDLTLAGIGLAVLGGALVVLLIPLPYPR